MTGKLTQVRTCPLDKSACREIGLVWRSGSAREQEFKMLGDIIRDNRGTQATPSG